MADEVREALAALVDANASTVVAMLRQTTGGDGPYPPLAAVAAANSLVRAGEDVLRALVRQARAAGHTWSDIGDVLGTSRQAAQQRFARTTEGAPSMPEALAGAEERASAHLDALLDGRYDDLSADFDDRMRAGLPVSKLSQTTAQLTAQVGALRERGEPTVKMLGGFTTVDIPLTFERAPLKARIAYDDAGRITGLFLLDPNVA